MFRAVTAAAVIAGLSFAPPIFAQGQDVRYVGYAASVVQSDGSAEDEVFAGGVAPEAPCGRTRSKTCPIGDPSCFAVSCGGSTTIGGAFDAFGVPRPGFPRVESATSGQQSVLFGLLQISSGGTRAIADAETGELTTECSCDQLLLNLIPLGSCPSGAGVPFPVDLLTGTFIVTPCARSESVENGVSIVSIASAVVEDPVGNEATVGLSVAGVEIPSTSGGGGCQVEGGERPIETGALALMLGGLWLLRRRLARGNQAAASARRRS